MILGNRRSEVSKQILGGKRMDLKGSNRYPSISGNLSADRAVWGLALALWEVAIGAVSREAPTMPASSEEHASREGGVLRSEAAFQAGRLLLKPAEVATALAIGRGTVCAMLHAGEIPSVRIGRNIRVSRKALERWIEDQQVS
jgi:excisionase family DNA binding protein